MLSFLEPHQLKSLAINRDLNKLIVIAGILFFLFFILFAGDKIIWAIPSAIFFFIFIWLIFINPFIGLQMLILLVFSNLFAGLEIPGGYFAFSLLVILAWVLHQSWHFKLSFLIPKKQMFFVALVIAAILMSIPFSLNQKVSMFKLIVWIKSIILYMLIINLVTTKKRLFVCLSSIFSALIISFFYGLYILYKGASAVLHGQTTYEAINRLIGLNHDPNIYAATLIAFIPVPLYLFFHAETKGERTGGFILFAIFILATILTFSRGGILSLVLLLIIFLIKNYHYRSVVFVGIMAAIVILFSIPAELWDRFGDIANFRGDSSVNERFKLLSNAWYYFLDNPILGIGIGNFIEESIRFISRHQPVHNIFLEIATETGVIGLLSFVGLTWITLRYFEESRILFTKKNKRQLANLAKALKLGFYGFLFACLFLSLQQDTQFWTLLGLAAALRGIAELPEEKLT